MSLAAMFRDAPIKRKLMLIGLLTSGLALLSISLILTARDIVDWRNRTVAELTSYASVIGANTVSALLFDDRKAAAETLTTLAAKADLIHAVIYDGKGVEFSAYHAPYHAAVTMPRPQPGRYIFTFDSLVVAEYIVFKDDRLGTIYLESDLKDLYAGILRDSGLIFVVAFGVFLVAALMFAKLQKAFVSPILELSQTMQTVSGQQNYGVRVVPRGKDEVGMLAHTFNDMLDRIQQRDVELAQHRARLEQEVALRTARLTEAQRIAHLGNWELDVVNNVLAWSDEIYRIFGLTPRQFGATPEAFMQTVHPQDRQYVETKAREALESGRPYNIDHRILLPDGTLRHVHEMAEVFRNGNGQAVRMVGTVQDITEDKLAEAELRASEQKFMQLFTRIPIPLAVADDAGQINVNDQFSKVFGYTRNDIPTLNEWWRAAYPDPSYRQWVVEKWDAAVAKAVSEGTGIQPAEYRVTCKSGAERIILLGGTSLEATVVATFIDITERKRAEESIRTLNAELEQKVLERTQQLLDAQEELVRKEKLAVLGQVAGSVGHELRNPLGVMSNAVYFLQTVLAEADETTKEYLGIIKAEIAGSERIVSDLLDAVRTKPPHTETVGLRELIGQTLRKYAVPPAVSVKLEIPATLPPLRVDAMQIHQVLRNLISNGVEAMPAGGTLEISALENHQDGTVTVSVRDSGSGIAPEVLHKMFQPLFTTKARGIGLGLVVVKNLTQANGGTVKVDSETGKGATFSITLPTADAGTEAAQ